MRKFEKEYNVKVSITTFENEEEACRSSRARSGRRASTSGGDGRVRLARGGLKLIQPINHSYLANLKNVWASLQNPYYDRHARYTVPYTVYTTGIGYRTDKLKKTPADYANPYDIFWDSHQYAGKVAILDDDREALAMTLLRRRLYDVNTEDAKLDQPGGRRTSPNSTSMVECEGQRDRLHRYPLGCDLDLAGVVGRHGRRAEYMPKGVPGSVSVTGVRTRTPRRQNDMITILRGAKRPVLAHAFLNFLLDNKVGLENFAWHGYMPPHKVVDPNTVVAQGYIPANLASTVVREAEFQNGETMTPLTANGETLWQDAWSKFKAG